MNVRLLLVDDHPLWRDGLRQAVAHHPNLTVAGEAGSGSEAVKLAVKLAPDVVVNHCIHCRKRQSWL